MTLNERIPLLRDHHTHPYLYATLEGCLDLRFVEDKQRALQLIKGSFAEGDVNVVIGWNDSLYSFSPSDIEDLPPLIVMNASLHSFQMNDAAVEVIAPRFPGIVANRGDRVWMERNAPLIMGFVMGISPGSAERIASFYLGLAEKGVWYAEEMTLWEPAEIAMYDAALLGGRSRFWATADLYQGLDEESAKLVEGIKLFADGALGSRTAMLSRPYLGGEEGILIYDDGGLLHQLSLAAEAGKGVAVHAIGDRAIDQVVDAVGRLGKRSPVTRIEHCQFISPKSARRAKSLGICLSMQPNFSMESDFYGDRLPRSYLEWNNPFRMLIDQVGFVPGEDLIFGSDGMPHGAFYALRSALFPPMAGQRLTLEEFVAGYCMPDFTHGFIDVTIDLGGQTVAAEVTLK